MKRHIAIIGGGPIGLEAALYARTLGHDVTVYERGNAPADNVRAWEFVTLFSPWEMNTTPLGWRAIGTRMPAGRICPTAKELRDQYLLRLAETMGDSIRTGVTVLAIGKPDAAAGSFQLRVRDRNGDERVDLADVVLDCSGTYGNHRWMGRNGNPAPGEREAAGRIFYTLPDVLGRDRERFRGHHTLVLGAGYSAATVLQWIEHLHQHGDTNTKASWAVRGVGPTLCAIHDDPLPARASLVAHSIKLADQPPPWLQYLGDCTLERVDATTGPKLGVTLRYRNTDLALAVDEMVALVGYAPDASIHESLRRDEPGFFVLGAKSYGTNSNFLMQAGHTQVRETFRVINDDPQLDLYRTP